MAKKMRKTRRRAKKYVRKTRRGGDDPEQMQQAPNIITLLNSNNTRNRAESEPILVTPEQKSNVDKLQYILNRSIFTAKASTNLYRQIVIAIHNLRPTGKTPENSEYAREIFNIHNYLNDIIQLQDDYKNKDIIINTIVAFKLPYTDVNVLIHI